MHPTTASILIALGLSISSTQSAVTVGSSSLIGQLDYSDTFTIGAGASSPARQAYVAQTFPLPARRASP